MLLKLVCEVLFPRVCHVRRFVNITAHRIIKLALIFNFGNCWFEEPQELIHDVLLKDYMLS